MKWDRHSCLSVLKNKPEHALVVLQMDTNSMQTHVSRSLLRQSGAHAVLHIGKEKGCDIRSLDRRTPQQGLLRDHRRRDLDEHEAGSHQDHGEECREDQLSDKNPLPASLLDFSAQPHRGNHAV